MAQILPFKGFRYVPSRVGKIASVVTQPYDTISPEMQAGYYAKSAYNVVRIIRGKEHDIDTPDSNQYTRASQFFQDWLQTGIIAQDPEPSIYMYEQIYHLPNGESKSRLGFIAVGKLEPFDKGVVFPHERTHSKPKEDRLRLLNATRTHFGQIFMLYSDPRNAINTILRNQQKTLSPVFDFRFEENIQNRLWRVSAPEIITQIQNLMADKTILIADGHHRYETALNFMQANSDLPTAQYVMMTFVNTDDPGLSILPTHRLLKTVPPKNRENFWKKIKELFTVQEFRISQPEKFFEAMTELGNQGNTFGFYEGKKVLYTLTVENAAIKDRFYSEKNLQHLKDLDVSVFDELIIKYVFNLDKEKENYIAYSKDAEETIRLVEQGEFQFGFLLNPTKIAQVKAITSIGERMPQKSTYFYPKLLTGLVFYKL